MDKIKESVKDIDVSLLFNNAGFITMGLFADVNIGRLNVGNQKQKIINSK
jgi:short-subunit dehydrogenase